MEPYLRMDKPEAVTSLLFYWYFGSAPLAGKTHSMLGPSRDVLSLRREDQGIIPAALMDLFDHIQKHTDESMFLLRVSYIEVYNEEINDLLGEGSESKNLKIIKDDPQKGTFFPPAALFSTKPILHFVQGAVIGGLTEVVVSSPQEALDLLRDGEQKRHVAGTNMNERSSRSHTVFRVVIESTPSGSNAIAPEAKEDTRGRTFRSVAGGSGSGLSSSTVRVSYLNMVDLAG